MKTLVVLALLAATVPSVAVAGEIYGTITENGAPVKEGMKVALVCGEKSHAGETDKNGAYRLFAEEGFNSPGKHAGGDGHSHQGQEQWDRDPQQPSLWP